MTFPVTGALILVVGAGFFLFRPKLLYSATIVAIPFTATAVVNFGWTNAVGSWGRSLEAWQFFFMLWIGREVLSSVPPWRRTGWFLTRRARNGLFAFLAAAILSLSVPLVASGTTWVLVPRPLTDEMIPLRLSSFDLTQTAYLAFGLLFALFVSAENSNSRKLFRTLRLYVGSCTFAAAWGLLELWCELTGHVYPAAVFNTSTNISASGYEETDLLGNLSRIGRLSSVSQEPSVLARLLLYALVALLVCMAVRRPILRKNWDLLAMILISVTLIASTSSTAYFGIPLALLIVVVALYRMGRPVKLYISLTLAVVTAGVFVAKAVPMVGSIFTTFILEKYTTGSGVGRLDSVIQGVRIFSEHPLLGVGWYNADSHDLLFMILANMGLVGLLAFASFAFPVFRALWASAAKRKPSAVVFLSVYILAILLAEATSPSYVAGFFWLALGLGAAATIAARSEPSLKDLRRAEPLDLQRA